MKGIKWFGKRQIILAGLVFALGLAVYLNYYFTNNAAGKLPTGAETKTTASRNLGDAQYVSGSAKDYFTQARASRESARNEALDIVKDILGSAKLSGEALKEATGKAAIIAEAVKQESNIESLVIAKGYADCVAYIDGTGCSVVVKKEKLTAGDTAAIVDIVTGHSAVKAEKITITAVNS